ncbi:hypothetical protein [Flammeovirga aprica]|uniref:Uncharacterized protein n=1 Tax=Flammeovirga aprica JL-4 TaxID=694437 RepID=A0A7X9P0A3_9BACT|nr:hypothetical protein [Flammeovirga aprica]NME67191.1 hypothetical protein [Flammeovirga aprica JL-4]
MGEIELVEYDEFVRGGVSEQSGVGYMEGFHKAYYFKDEATMNKAWKAYCEFFYDIAKDNEDADPYDLSKVAFEEVESFAYKSEDLIE